MTTLLSVCTAEYDWSDWGPCLPCYSSEGVRNRTGTCISCCVGEDDIIETEPCNDCQCEVTAEDIEYQLGFLPEDNVLGTIEDSDIVIEIDANGTFYLEYNTTVVGKCHECQCLFNGSFVCSVDLCSTTVVTVTRTPTTVTPPLCRTSWTQWSQCPPEDCNATTTRTRYCNTSDPNCRCLSPGDTEVAPCNLCSSTTSSVTPYFISSSTMCPPDKHKDCYNLCNDTCRYHNDPSCEVTSDECVERCKCPDGYLEDDTGDCVKIDQCPCYHNGTWYPPGFNVTYPDSCEQCSCDSNHGYNCSSIPGCCIYPDWTEWSPCNATCAQGVQTRRKVGLNPECPEDLEQERPCNGSCVCVIEGQEYPNGTSVPPDDECSKCTCVNNDTECEPDPNLTVNGTWTTWGEWSLCTGSSNCRDYMRTRCRYCSAPKCGGIDCEGSSIDVEPCSELPCCAVFKWSEWSDCSVRCQGGSRSRTKIFADDATAEECANTDVIEYEECGDCENCPEDDTTWTAWSDCSTTSAAACGWGQRSRTRPGPACSGVKEDDAESCFLGPCECPDDLQYSNHSECQPTCLQRHPDPACLLTPTPGCVCPAGMVLEGTECVPPETCDQCVYNNVTYQPGEQWECGTCGLCQCCGGHVTTVPRPCPDISDCNLDTHRLEISDDECCPIKCVEKKCELKTEPPVKLTVGECISREPVTVQYCEGECKRSSHRLDYTKSTLGEKECTCCAAQIASYTDITLDCPGGVTKEHTIPILGKCLCDVSVCPA
ncbi:hypothetical protein V1264_013247 [Littorina saxatilis]|uniref:CTCK domain-containing protein n=1 Tax=Littorina saxatilis TaxID=31220 RepID=A0AAN9GIC1_9CAEN